MQDLHKELMKRSFQDAYAIAMDMEEEYDVPVPPEVYPKMALGLYQHRVQRARMKEGRAIQQAQMPNTTPGSGQYE